MLKAFLHVHIQHLIVIKTGTNRLSFLFFLQEHIFILLYFYARGGIIQ